jgi:hypothetical protein
MTIVKRWSACALVLMTLSCAAGRQPPPAEPVGPDDVLITPYERGALGTLLQDVGLLNQPAPVKAPPALAAQIHARDALLRRSKELLQDWREFYKACALKNDSAALEALRDRLEASLTEEQKALRRQCERRVGDSARLICEPSLAADVREMHEHCSDPECQRWVSSWSPAQRAASEAMVKAALTCSEGRARKLQAETALLQADSAPYDTQRDLQNSFANMEAQRQARDRARELNNNLQYIGDELEQINRSLRWVPSP